jgi:hypothetical protein
MMVPVEKCGLEEVEMFIRFAGQQLQDVYADLGHNTSAEYKIAGAEALIEVTRQILKRLIRDGAQAEGGQP